MPVGSRGPSREMTGQEGAYLLNATDQDAHVRVVLYFSDREPSGPYRLVVPARRTRHLRFNDLHDPEGIPPGSGYSSVICSDVPIVVQQTRFELRQGDEAELAAGAHSSAYSQ
jgi:hypothetical protein